MAVTDLLPPTTSRVESRTDPELNELNELRTYAQLARLEKADPVEIDARLAELDREWGIERVLQANAGTIVLASVALARLVDRRFLLLTTAVFSFFAQHTLHGWCPPLPILRRNGVRTMREIERERYAIKALRGDFDQVPGRGATNPDQRVRAALAAVDA
jgi:hypothetical protein